MDTPHKRVNPAGQAPFFQPASTSGLTHITIPRRDTSGKTADPDNRT